MDQESMDYLLKMNHRGNEPRHNTINESTDMLVKDISEYSADALLNEIIIRRGEDDYEMFIFGELICGPEPI